MSETRPTGEDSPCEAEALLGAELRLSELAIRSFPKSHEAWAHRRWLMALRNPDPPAASLDAELVAEMRARRPAHSPATRRPPRNGVHARASSPPPPSLPLPASAEPASHRSAKGKLPRRHACIIQCIDVILCSLGKLPRREARRARRPSPRGAAGVCRRRNRCGRCSHPLGAPP